VLRIDPGSTAIELPVAGLPLYYPAG